VEQKQEISCLLWPMPLFHEREALMGLVGYPFSPWTSSSFILLVYFFNLFFYALCFSFVGFVSPVVLVE
jgi:hypothetical protein